MNTKNSLIEESKLWELTDTELQSVFGGRYPTYGYRFGPINQYTFTNDTYNGQYGAFSNSGSSNNTVYGPNLAPSQVVTFYL